VTTVTGTAYLLDAQTGEFDPDDEEVRADLAHPHRPQSVFGYVVEGRTVGAGPGCPR
jgi:mannitol-1-phosphate/altronate dehydrogenase